MRRLRFLAAALALLSGFLACACSRRAPEYTIVEPKDGLVEVRFVDGSIPPVQFYTYKCNGRNVNFFVRRDREGIVRTHFDACYSCFQYKMGYTTGDNQVICRACRIAYELDEPVWDFVGPCAPITLSSSAKDGVVRIETRVLEKGSRFF